jgi:hypothetical protein
MYVFSIILVNVRTVNMNVLLFNTYLTSGGGKRRISGIIRYFYFPMLSIKKALLLPQEVVLICNHNAHGNKVDNITRP